MRGKLGLSPVVATTLLVGIVIILGVIIFFWARTVLPELIQKDGVNIEQFCDNVEFEASAVMSSGDVRINLVNRGTAPIFSLAIRKVGGGGSENIGLAEFEGDTLGISPGQTAVAVLEGASGISNGDTIFIAPVLLGETDVEKRPHVCDDEFGSEVVVGG